MKKLEKLISDFYTDITIYLQEEFEKLIKKLPDQEKRLIFYLESMLMDLEFCYDEMYFELFRTNCKKEKKTKLKDLPCTKSGTCPRTKIRTYSSPKDILGQPKRLFEES
jgi:hypothetical protein